MPDAAIESSANLDDRTSLLGLCGAVRTLALAKDDLELGVAHAIRCESASADKPTGDGFVHILPLGRGRSLGDKKAIGDTIFATADAFLAPPIAAPHYVFSLKIVEIDGDFCWKKDTIHPRTLAKA